MGSLKYKYSDELSYLRKNVLPIVNKEGEKYILSILKHLEEDEKLFDEMNTPKKPIIQKWDPSDCPTCRHDFFDYEPCDDGYYQRAYGLERCPYCGQKLNWD